MAQIGDDIDLTQQTDVVLDPQLAKNEYPTEGLKKAGPRNLVAKYLTPEMWEEYKDKKSNPAGFTFAQAINTGIKNPESYVGCHAGDRDSYYLYGDLFDHVINDYHGGYSKDATHPTDMEPDNLKVDIVHKNGINSTRIRCARNLEGDSNIEFGLAPGMKDVAVKKAVEETLIKAFDKLEGDLAGTYYSLETMSDADRKQLIEDHFLFKGADKMQADSGYHRWWPKGRGIFHNKSKTFLCWINEGDHLRIISMEKGGDVGNVFRRWARGANAVEAAIKEVTGGRGFLRDDHLGMINCCPSNLGNGLRAGVHVRLPNIVSKYGMDKLQALCSRMHIQARGIHGEHSESEGGVVDISNKYRLGYSEVQLVTYMVEGLNKLMDAEQKIAAGADVSILDAL